MNTFLKNTDKNSLRQQILKKRKRLTLALQKQHATAICQQLIKLKPMQNAHSIALYLAHHGEADPTLIMDLLGQQKAWSLPVVLDNKQLAFYPYQPGDQLKANQFEILEPTHNQNAIDPKNIDVIILPLVGFDEAGNRLGRGIGYYDRALSFMQGMQGKSPYLIGTAYEFQKVLALQTDAWDIPLNCVVTEKQTYTI